MNNGSTTRKLPKGTAQDRLNFLARYEPAIVLLTGSAAGSEFPLVSDCMILGRGPDVDFAFEDDHMSRQHAALELTADGFQLRDLGSTNGILVNDKPVDVALLQHGDRFAIGQLTFQYVVLERSAQAEFEVSE